MPTGSITAAASASAAALRRITLLLPEYLEPEFAIAMSVILLPTVCFYFEAATGLALAASAKMFCEPDDEHARCDAGDTCHSQVLLLHRKQFDRQPFYPVGEQSINQTFENEKQTCGYD